MRLMLLCLVLCLPVTACGAKGPIYLPERQYPQGAPSP
jgi:predicted small lipoprotein YifL